MKMPREHQQETTRVVEFDSSIRHGIGRLPAAPAPGPLTGGPAAGKGPASVSRVSRTDPHVPGAPRRPGDASRCAGAGRHHRPSSPLIVPS